MNQIVKFGQVVAAERPSMEQKYIILYPYRRNQTPGAAQQLSRKKLVLQYLYLFVGWYKYSTVTFITPRTAPASAAARKVWIDRCYMLCNRYSTSRRKYSKAMSQYSINLRHNVTASPIVRWQSD